MSCFHVQEHVRLRDAPAAEDDQPRAGRGGGQRAWLPDGRQLPPGGPPRGRA